MVGHFVWKVIHAAAKSDPLDTWRYAGGHATFGYTSIEPLTQSPPHSRDFSRELGGAKIDKTECIWYNSYMEKSLYLCSSNGLAYGRGYVYSLQYHLVWCTKYRRPVFQNEIAEEVKTNLKTIAGELEFTIDAMEVMPDHIHLLISAKPQLRISDAMKIIKGNLARWLFLKHPEIKNQLWGGHLWNPSYCSITVSDRSRDQIKHYIETQKKT